MTNEALAKAAEEQAGGLAADQPLVATERSRRHTGGACRMDSLALLIEELARTSGELAMVPLRIATAWRIQDNPARMKSAMKIYGHVTGIRLDDAQAQASDLSQAYDAWRAHMQGYGLQRVRDVTLSICAQGMTFTEAGRRVMASGRQAKRDAVTGCLEYLEANRESRPEPVHVQMAGQPEPFRTSRIVIFDLA